MLKSRKQKTSKVASDPFAPMASDPFAERDGAAAAAHENRPQGESMPPPAPKGPLAGISAVVDVWVCNGASDASDVYATRLRKLGAKATSGKVGSDTTHLVFKDGCALKFEAARKRALRIVPSTWVIACEEEEMRLDEEAYASLVKPPKPSERPRSADPAPLGEMDEIESSSQRFPETSRTRTEPAGGSKARASVIEEDEEEEEEEASGGEEEEEEEAGEEEDKAEEEEADEPLRDDATGEEVAEEETAMETAMETEDHVDGDDETNQVEPENPAALQRVDPGEMNPPTPTATEVVSPPQMTDVESLASASQARDQRGGGGAVGGAAGKAANTAAGEAAEAAAEAAEAAEEADAARVQAARVGADPVDSDPVAVPPPDTRGVAPLQEANRKTQALREKIAQQPKPRGKERTSPDRLPDSRSRKSLEAYLVHCGHPVPKSKSLAQLNAAVRSCQELRARSIDRGDSAADSAADTAAMEAPRAAKRKSAAAAEEGSGGSAASENGPIEPRAARKSSRSSGADPSGKANEKPGRQPDRQVESTRASERGSNRRAEDKTKGKSKAKTDEKTQDKSDKSKSESKSERKSESKSERKPKGKRSSETNAPPPMPEVPKRQRPHKASRPTVSTEPPSKDSTSKASFRPSQLAFSKTGTDSSHHDQLATAQSIARHIQAGPTHAACTEVCLTPNVSHSSAPVSHVSAPPAFFSPPIHHTCHSSFRRRPSGKM